ncbi:hypothetical protein ACO22_01214 [Paracoccidioides brasiliensis]|uniref:Uncharacterized protein n=1 Tax=Paracoccidioides brasiliensis TaxID=121759 RepID=A0A1D2JM70_PARBR|nr:hypothetical protein ACO22_01214 [Paracoccidioides brasiliensis]
MARPQGQMEGVDASSSQAAIIVSDDTTPSMKNSKWTDASYGILTTQIEKSESGGDRFTIRCHAIDSKLLNTFENGLKADGIENKSKPQGLEGDGKLIDRNPQGPPRPPHPIAYITWKKLKKLFLRDWSA